MKKQKKRVRQASPNPSLVKMYLRMLKPVKAERVKVKEEEQAEGFEGE
ncbi:hypothetical protein [Pedobacter aquatilis]|nr:hypothetical protein [Pedobacter aquatilis]